MCTFTVANKAIEDTRLRPRNKQSRAAWPLTGAAIWLTRPNITSSDWFSPLCENMTSSAKPEVHNVFALSLEEEDWVTATSVTFTANFVKFVHVDFETCEQTDRQTHGHTYTLIVILPTHFGGEVTIASVVATCKQNARMFAGDCNIYSVYSRVLCCILWPSCAT